MAGGKTSVSDQRAAKPCACNRSVIRRELKPSPADRISARTSGGHCSNKAIPSRREARRRRWCSKNAEARGLLIPNDCMSCRISCSFLLTLSRAALKSPPSTAAIIAASNKSVTPYMADNTTTTFSLPAALLMILAAATKLSRFASDEPPYF